MQQKKIGRCLASLFRILKIGKDEELSCIKVKDWDSERDEDVVRWGMDVLKLPLQRLCIKEMPGALAPCA